MFLLVHVCRNYAASKAMRRGCSEYSGQVTTSILRPLNYVVVLTFGRADGAAPSRDPHITARYKIAPILSRGPRLREEGTGELTDIFEL